MRAAVTRPVAAVRHSKLGESLGRSVPVPRSAAPTARPLLPTARARPGPTSRSVTAARHCARTSRPSTTVPVRPVLHGLRRAAGATGDHRQPGWPPPPGRRCPALRRPGRHRGSGTAWRRRRRRRSARAAPTTATDPGEHARVVAQVQRDQPAAAAARRGRRRRSAAAPRALPRRDLRQSPGSDCPVPCGSPAGTRSTTGASPSPYCALTSRLRGPRSGRKTSVSHAGRQVLQRGAPARGRGEIRRRAYCADEGDHVVGRPDAAQRPPRARQPSTSRPRDRACWRRSGATPCGPQRAA